MVTKGMKESLKSDLQALAGKIQNLSENTSVSDLQNSAKELYEKLTILKFVEENLDGQKVAEPISETIIEAVVKEEEEVIIEDDFGDSGMLSTLDEDLFVSDEGMDEHIIELATEKMIDIVERVTSIFPDMEKSFKWGGGTYIDTPPKKLFLNFLGIQEIEYKSTKSSTWSNVHPMNIFSEFTS